MPRKHNRGKNRLAKIVTEAERFIEKQWAYNPSAPRVTEMFRNDPTAVIAINSIKGSGSCANKIQWPSL